MPLLIIVPLAELARVGLGVLHVDHSLWLSLHDNLLSPGISLLEAVEKVLVIRSLFELSTISRYGVGDFNDAFPRSHLLAIFAVHPVGWLFSSLHLEHLHAGSIRFHGQVILTIFHWIKDGISNQVTFPLIIKFHKSHREVRFWEILCIYLVYSSLGNSLISGCWEHNWASFLFLRELGKELELCNSIDSTFPSNHLSHLVIHQNILVGETW